MSKNDHLFEAKDAMIEKYVARRGLKGKITAMCIDCIYDPMDKGAWRKQVHRCTATACPLYSVRPLSKGEV